MTSMQLQAQALLELKRRGIKPLSSWPDTYISNRTNKSYTIHNEQIRQFIYNDRPRYMLLKGGEGGGKSAAGVIKNLERLRRGMSGIMVSTDLEHFKKSIWPTFKEWCPWHRVIEKQRYRRHESWQPSQSFTIVFNNDVGGYSELMCGGAQETSIGGWEGPNVNFIHIDEARRYNTSIVLKVFDGRARIPGPDNQPPQIYLTTTPRKHWLYNYFGPIADNDKLADFKHDSFVATVLTEENIANLDSEFVRQRAQTLSEAERRILLFAEWEDESDIDKFVEIIWWDNCRESIRPITRDEPAIIALDAATGSESVGYIADCFALVMVTRHPERKQDIMIRHCAIYQANSGELLDFAPIEAEIRRLCSQFAVIEVAYDPHQLHDMAMRLKQSQIANFKAFSQQSDRLKSDKQLQ